jgi:pimeloyl-ACP methyl ester carboxylesterase
MSRRNLRPRVAFLVGLSALVAVTMPGASTPAVALDSGTKPTIVLVHGAFADASGWDAVIDGLSRGGYRVIAPANPLRSLSSDADYLASVLATIPGPVVLVGHSYGGAVITNAATHAPNVKALVYIAAFAPDRGETAFGLIGAFPGSALPLALKLRPYRAGGDQGIDGYIDPARFHDVFCADLPAVTAEEMAAAQRPATVASGAEPSGEPAWRTIPSWYLVARQDHAIAPAAELFMAHRAGAHTVEIDSSHVAMISHPDRVLELIRAAAKSVR